MREEIYMPISAFARISDVSRKALIFYDKIGLFTPAYVNEKGYRYYAHSQIETITVINTLSNLGLSLEEIKAYLKDFEPEKALEMLQTQNEVIERKISSLRSVQDMIQMRIKFIEEGLEQTEEIQVIDQEEIPLYISEKFNCDTNAIPDDIWVQFYDACEEKGISFCYPICYIVKKEDLADHRYHMVSHLSFRMGSSQKSNYCMPKGRYLIGYGHFHYGDTLKLYEKLCQYAAEHGLEIGGDAYEEYMLDEVTTSQADAYQVKISIQLKM